MEKNYDRTGKNVLSRNEIVAMMCQAWKPETAEEQETLLSLLEKFRNSFSAGICVVCGEKVVKKYFHDYLCYRKNVVEWIIV